MSVINSSFRALQYLSVKALLAFLLFLGPAVALLYLAL